MTAPAPRDPLAELRAEVARLRETVATLAAAEGQTRQVVHTMLAGPPEPPTARERMAALGWEEVKPPVPAVSRHRGSAAGTGTNWGRS